MHLPEPHFLAPVAMFRPQETALVPTVSGQLERSSRKAEAIRRGDLKISGPISLTEDEERELAKRNSDLTPQRTNSTSTRHLLHKKSINAGSHNTDPVETTSELLESPPRLRHKRSSTGIRDLSEMQRHTSPDPPASYNSPSPFASASESSAKMAPKKKRKSGLRSVFRKIFGRSKGEIKRDSAQKHGYHHSDPGVLTTPAPAKSKENVGRNSLSAVDQRISDLPVRELKPINPLGQHLPFPMNVNAPEEVSPPHDYLTFESPPKLHRRRATLPSVVLSRAEIAALSATWSGSGARVIPLDEQGQAESVPSPEIGVALSSPTHNKRRSRSAGALRESSTRQDSLPRRRSAEIRYWRTSGMDRSASVYSTATPRPQDYEDGTKDTEEVVDETMHTEGVKPTADDGPSDIPLPIQAFNFGALKSEFEASEDDIEDAIESPPTLEERVQRLESGMQVLEQSLHRLTGRSHRQTIILENAPKGRRSRQHSHSTARDEYSRQSSKSSSQELNIKEEPSNPPSPSLPPTFLTSPSSTGSANIHITPFPLLAKPPSPKTQDNAPSAAQPSTTTNPSEQFTAIYTILRHERTARKALEKQVLSLQREVADLRSLVLKLSASAYPTPSPDAVLGSSEEVRTPRAYRRPERGLGFESEEESGVGRGRTRERITSRFSKSDSEGGNGDGEEDDGTRVGEEMDEGEKGKGVETGRSSSAEVTSPDIWATPREEVAGYGFFGRPGVVGQEGGMI